jgi:lipopolysaccharide export system permease protein
MTMTMVAAELPRMRRLRLSATLTGYVARQFTFRLFTVFLVLVGIIILVSVVDLLDRMATKDNVGLTVVLEMVFLKLPYLSQELMPFTVLFAAMATFWRLTRSNEVVVTRAAGVSVWQFLLPVVAVAVLAGIFTVTILNPVSSVLLARFEQLESRYVKNQASFLTVSESGLWLRQADPDGQSVIHAQRVSKDSITLKDVIIFRLGDNDRFVGRIDGRRAELQDGRWLIRDAWLSNPGKASVFQERVELPTDLTLEKIQESFAAPETISFWGLPNFIRLLESAGFSAQRHKLQLHRLLAMPLLYAAMILVAATFSLRPQRRGKVVAMILAGVAAGFLLYFLSNFVFALGLSAKIPVILAGWTPAGVSMMLGIAMLLHLEDG